MSNTPLITNVRTQRSLAQGSTSTQFSAKSEKRETNLPLQILTLLRPQQWRVRTAPPPPCLSSHLP